MATSLGKVGIVDRGNYSSEVTYNSGDFVFYEGSTWLALKDGLIGVNPAEGENWKYLARGVPENIQDEIDSIKNNKLDKTEFDNLQIGGRNLARGTSSEYAKEIIHSGGTNKNTLLARVYTDGLKIGDTVTLRLLYKYSDLVSETGQTGRVTPKGKGDVTGWDYGSFYGDTFKVTVGTGEYEFLYSFKINEDHLKNSYWDVYIRHDYIASGTSTWKMLKVEKGTKPTDWTPAPEDVQDQVNSIQNPTFDDSGTAEGINSFTDFIAKVKSKMNIFEFYRDFKAGMKYVLHTGRLVNNAVTTEEGFALDARMGKTLQDQITEQNNNINGNTYLLKGGKPLSDIDLNDIKERGNYYCPSNNFAVTILNTPIPNTSFTLKVYSATGAADDYLIQELTTYTGIKFIRKYTPNQVWSGWDKIILNSDLSMNLTVPNYSEAITLSDSISTYTAPSNGYIRSELIRTGTNITYWIIIQVNGVRVFIINGSDTTEMGVAFIPVSKGDVITWKFENSQYCKSIYNMFIPCK